VDRDGAIAALVDAAEVLGGVDDLLVQPARRRRV
jgi:hypothetical protein